VTVISNSVEILCSPEEAFDYLSDHCSELEWNPGSESIDKLTDGPVGLGTKIPRQVEERPEGPRGRDDRLDRPHGWPVHNGGPIEVTAPSGSSPRPPGPGSHPTSTPGRTGSSGSPSRYSSRRSAKKRRRT
jgi:hypothetical protein